MSRTLVTRLRRLEAANGNGPSDRVLFSAVPFTGADDPARVLAEAQRIQAPVLTTEQWQRRFAPEGCRP